MNKCGWTCGIHVDMYIFTPAELFICIMCIVSDEARLASFTSMTGGKLVSLAAT